ncbi:aldo/keto reductase [Saccharopolyspora gregorii]|uniref:NADP-dependent oxidoreductase domain-containing protein n=1 Tax=Saccharopolyspora gregorii TaxID=33914 RepID=A0ABP6S2X6_9PSEU
MRDAEKLYDTIEEVVGHRLSHRVSPAQISLAYLLRKPGVTSLVIGARKDEQLRDNLGRTEVRLSDDEFRKLDEISKPYLIYPHWHQGAERLRAVRRSGPGAARLSHPARGAVVVERGRGAAAEGRGSVRPPSRCSTAAATALRARPAGSRPTLAGADRASALSPQPTTGRRRHVDPAARRPAHRSSAGSCAPRQATPPMAEHIEHAHGTGPVRRTPDLRGAPPRPPGPGRKRAGAMRSPGMRDVLPAVLAQQRADRRTARYCRARTAPPSRPIRLAVCSTVRPSANRSTRQRCWSSLRSPARDHSRSAINRSSTRSSSASARAGPGRSRR